MKLCMELGKNASKGLQLLHFKVTLVEVEQVFEEGREELIDEPRYEHPTEKNLKKKCGTVIVFVQVLKERIQGCSRAFQPLMEDFVKKIVSTMTKNPASSERRCTENNPTKQKQRAQPEAQRALGRATAGRNIHSAILVCYGRLWNAAVSNPITDGEHARQTEKKEVESSLRRPLRCEEERVAACPSGGSS